MKVFIGSDHNGYALKEQLEKLLISADHEVVDSGPAKLDPADDFPVFARRVVTAMLASGEPDPRGILLCGSGQGMCMAANRHKGIRAALLYDLESARSSRNDDDSNVACLPADVLKDDKARSIVEAWLNTPFSGAARFRRRIHDLDSL